jgi:hypothetical protein
MLTPEARKREGELDGDAAGVEAERPVAGDGIAG